MHTLVLHAHIPTLTNTLLLSILLVCLRTLSEGFMAAGRCHLTQCIVPTVLQFLLPTFTIFPHLFPPFLQQCPTPVSNPCLSVLQKLSAMHPGARGSPYLCLWISTPQVLTFPELFESCFSTWFQILL